MNSFVLFGHGGYYNRGCEAIVRTTSAMLRGAIPDSRITLASYDVANDAALYRGIVDHYIPHGHHRYSVPWFFAALSRRCGLSSVALAFDLIWVWQYGFLRAGDIYMSIGGDNYCYQEPRIFFALDRILRKKGKKTILWGASLDASLMTERMKRDLMGFDLIIARESITFALLNELGIEHVYLHPDPAFLLPRDDLALPLLWRQENTIGINVGPLVMQYEKSSGIVMKAVYCLIRHILNSTDAAIALIPHVADGKAGSPQNDMSVLEPLFQEFKETNRVILIDPKHNAEQLKGYIARCRLFIGARTHSTIAAYSNCVPTLVLGYSVKSRGIARDLFDNEELVLDVRRVDREDELCRAFNALSEREREIKSQLSSVIPGYIARARGTVDHIKNLVAS